MAKTKDRRPPVAVGHIYLEATDVAAAARWLVDVGMRPIFAADDFAVLELRGGTHLVLVPGTVPRAGDAPFDLMVDDLEATRDRWAAEGLEPSEIERGDIHASFAVRDPDGYRVTVNSSHVIGEV